MTTPAEERPIVVGISRRTGSPDAVAFARHEAELRGTTVLAVSAWRPPRLPDQSVARPDLPPVTLASLTADEQARLHARLAEQLGEDPDGAGIRFEVRRGAPAAVLLAAAAEAQLLVLDSPRAGNITTVSKTWIAPAIVLRAPCPVVVMPQLEHGPSLGWRLAETAGRAARPGVLPLGPR